MDVNELPISDSLKTLVSTEKGIKKLFPPQEEAIKKGFFDLQKNFLLVTQTASGKTLLAELLLVENSLRKKGLSVYLSPLKALASEKYRDFLLYEKLGVKTALSLGDYDKADAYLEQYDVIVTTYEKMDSLLRHKPKWLSKINLVVIDEIHFVDDEERGPVLESLIAKLKLLVPSVKLVGMSATIGNPRDLAKWLDAELIISSWRPVPLKQGVFYKHKIIFDNGEELQVKKVFDHPIFDLVFDTISDNGQALVFVHSRKRAVDLANATAAKLGIKESAEARYYSQLLLESSDVPLLNNLLSSLVRKGVCFHHAGLTHEQRTIIEEAFRKGAIKVIYATPTLAAGVNLPARRVVVEDYRRYSGIVGYEEIKVIEYKQFAGRAGRPGYDEFGEAVLIARSQTDVKLLMERFIQGEPEKIESKLMSIKALRSHLLALIATLGPLGMDGVKEFFKNTFHGKTSSLIGFKSTYEKVLDFLSNNDFIEDRNGRYTATKLGKIVSEVYLDPMTVVVFRNLIKKVTRRLSDFGMLYIIAVSPDMPSLLVRRREEEQLESLLDVYYNEIPGTMDDAYIPSWEEYLSRLKTALFLYDWINEKPEQEIVEKYDLGPGDIRSLAETAEWIAHGLKKVSLMLEGIDSYLAQKLETIEIRLRYGVKEDIIELLAIPGVGRVRARRLYLAGFRTIEDIAKATPSQLKKIEGIGDALSVRLIEEARRLVGLS
ncbi:MAG: DEAD/DEAH box helicase [Desulfurococcales archaeon]|jgi:helicase|nr:DEAD/DEAH box helicase [Desulfurococcales archaeon]